MRYILGLCLLILAVPVYAGDPGKPDPAFEPLASWEGKPSDELIAAWGKPRKTKRDGKDRKVLVYRLRSFGGQIVGETKTSWSDVGIGSSPVDVSGLHKPYVSRGPELVFAGRPDVIGTQKVTFYVDERGVIQRAEFAPRKWKNKKP